MKNKLSVLLIVISAMTANTALAGRSIGCYVESMSLDTEKAAQEGIEDSAWAAGCHGDFFSNDRMTASYGIAFVQYDDNREFSQRVEVIDEFGHAHTRTLSSDASALLIYVDFGPRFTFGAGDSSYFSAKTGFSTFFDSERGIACGDCYSEDIDIDGGIYIQTALGHNFERYSIGFAYNQYLDDDKGVSDGLRFQVTTAF